ncbi:MAG: hypothetical protein JWR08_2314 [Enterovirga sp.]|nr:hypothetical protein [Enterovirga sp.]
MRSTILAFGAALLLAPTAASAQTAKEIYTYKAPSGMFGEGTGLWNMYRYMTEDAELRERLRQERETGTASISAPRSAQGTAINDQQVARPGETGSRRRGTR